jgi:hypothetical protein
MDGCNGTEETISLSMNLCTWKCMFDPSCEDNCFKSKWLLLKERKLSHYQKLVERHKIHGKMCLHVCKVLTKGDLSSEC